MRYCNHCDKHVSPKKKPIAWSLVIWLGIFTAGIFAIIYAMYRWFLVYRTRCPICGLKTKWKKQ